MTRIRTARMAVVAVGVAALGGAVTLGSGAPQAPEIIVYKSPTCGCCRNWVDHIRAAGFTVTVHDIATTDRYDALRAVSDQVLMETRWDGKRARCRSYVSELLDIVQGTGRRISAVCALQYQDLHLDKTKGAPHGAIRWPGETDKMGKEWWAPINARVRAALDRGLKERPGIGAAYLFPSPTNRAEPVRYELTRDWLVEAEQQAKLPKQQGSLWHAYRRAWATARKHLPDVDVAAAGGWKSTETLRRCYQQPDADTMLAVVLSGTELREKPA